MTQTSLPQPHEQRKLEALLLRLSKMQPISAKPIPMVQREAAKRGACSANSQVFFST
jgi:hypothetical protein